MEKVLINPETKQVLCFRNITSVYHYNDEFTGKEECTTFETKHEFFSRTRLDYFGKRISPYFPELTFYPHGELWEKTRSDYEKKYPDCVFVDYDACSHNILFEQRFCSL